MAVHLEATIVPGKLELLQTWVPKQPWLGGADASSLTQLGSYRFDDPAGQVGMESHLLGTADGQVLHVPLTYRAAPLPAGDLITTMTHAALGDRWVYDGCTDPAWVAALAMTIVTGGREADLFLDTGSEMVPQASRGQVRGSPSPGAAVPELRSMTVTHEGSTTVIRAGVTITVFRIPTSVTGTQTLTGTWAGQASPRLLATLE